MIDILFSIMSFLILPFMILGGLFAYDVYEDYKNVLSILKRTEYNPVEFIDYNRISFWLASRKFKKAYKDKQEWQNTINKN